MTDAYDLTRQARWEVEGFRRAAAEYERAATAADPSTLPSGQRILREVVPPLAAHIRLAQRDALLHKTRPLPWHGPVQLLDAQSLALITVCGALRGVLVESDGVDATVTSIAFSIAASLQDEIQFRAWIKDHREKRKSDGDLRDLEGAFKRTYPNARGRDWRRWKRKLGIETDAPWDNRVRLHTGAALLHWLVEAAPRRFEKFERSEAAQTKLCLRLSADTVQQMDDLEQRKALVRPRMMPMLIPPNDWEYAEC